MPVVPSNSFTSEISKTAFRGCWPEVAAQEDSSLSSGTTWMMEEAYLKNRLSLRFWPCEGGDGPQSWSK